MSLHKIGDATHRRSLYSKTSPRYLKNPPSQTTRVEYPQRLGVVASVVRRKNEVIVHWARLVLGWVTVFGRVYHQGV